ncbi:MAG TPA: hypothetical protein VJO52_10370 [Gemmatimonadaceae bacterium]|nr:hypothetical protein [Gemmatimonadaceae bacterium]
MKPLDVLKLALLLVGIGIWAYGLRYGHNDVMVVGVAFVVVAFLLRFLPKIIRRS